MAKPHPLKPLARFLAYILGRNPAEFGLVPDPDGFIKIKDVLKALSEEEGWRHVRRAHINEILISLPHPPIEVKEKHIRAVSRENLPKRGIASNLPKLLFTCIRQKAYPHVLEKGLYHSGQSHVILSSSRKMALRIGRRIDQDPVLLTINIDQAGRRGSVFYESGGTLFLAEHIPPGVFSGPALPKTKTDLKKEENAKKAAAPVSPGSFVIKDQKPYGSSKPSPRTDVKRPPGGPKSRHKRKKDKSVRERPPWRK